MAKKKAAIRRGTSTAPPQIYEASLGPGGAVIKGPVLTQQQAVARRRTGQNVVVCGPNLAANRSLAYAIESTANGQVKRCPPHASAGTLALPHFQPDPRPPAGHTF